MRFFVFRPPLGEARSASLHGRLFIEGDLAFGQPDLVARLAPGYGEGAFDYLSDRQVGQLVTFAGVRGVDELIELDQKALNRARDQVRGLGDSGVSEEPAPAPDLPSSHESQDDPLAAQVRALVGPGNSARLKELAKLVGVPVGSMEANAAAIVEAMQDPEKRARITKALEG